MESLTYKEYQQFKLEQLGIKIPIPTIQSQIKRGALQYDPEYRYPRKIIMNENAINMKPIERKKRERKVNEFYSAKEHKNFPF